ncbi:M23 family metallopeptidase [Gracilibacillus salinarum]|uniref:M23 family metallopeptidase n=1 Tax=Gracilibacillus salinarum TaxID=2932255 RepID=A0ABY4GJA2_9BACI|nr:M23 family metallopeptidase [Gracilibacillus salinarum]UOQ83542.1 M23 family metallopeptidase [Gracilibacillus salinarum]
MTLAIIQLVIFQLILPIIFILSLLRGKFKGKTDWALQAFMYSLYISWVFFSGRWDWTIYYLRFLWPVLLMIALYISWRGIRSKPLERSYTGKDKLSFAFCSLLALVFAFYHVPIFAGYSTNDKAIELEFPLQNGTFYVGHGGASTQINYHHAHPEQQYAVDMVQLNMLGVRTAGVYPEELERYEIYGAKLVSPCSGEVVDVRTDMSDLNPPETDSEQPKGNYVQIQCEEDEVNVFIAHMQEDSATVESGNMVEAGQPIGLVGNSGNTSEPHLHIHAVKNGQGVPITFDGRFLVRNSLVWN